MTPQMKEFLNDLGNLMEKHDVIIRVSDGNNPDKIRICSFRGGHSTVCFEDAFTGESCKELVRKALLE